MAESLSHKFGQVIGNILESLLLPVFLKFCAERGLYLDRHGSRLGVRGGQKVSWEDKYGNSHDLDFVIEKDGSAKVRGKPVAFIEAAWRRYTKHSKNKAQEIQGAVLPIAEKYELEAPFLGAVLAGLFTEPSLNQLRSVGFEIVYLPYTTIIAAFASVGIDAEFDEDTEDDDFGSCVQAIEDLSAAQVEALKSHLLNSNKAAFDNFFGALRKKLDRIIANVIVTPLFGNPITFQGVADASKFIEEFDIASASGEFRKYELTVVFSNGDKIQGVFASKDRAKEFLDHVSA